MKNDYKHLGSCICLLGQMQQVKYFQKLNLLLILLFISSFAFAGTGDKVTVSGGTGTTVGANGDYYYAGTTTLNGVTRAYYDKPSSYYRVEFRYNSTFKLYEWEVWESTDLGGGGTVRFYNPSLAVDVPTANWALDVAAGIPVVTFTSAAVAVSAVSPQNGRLAGGTSVSITGTGFTAATAVKFGAVAATSYTVNSSTSITAVSPAGSAGTVDVTVTTANGTSATSSADQFTYVAAPTATTGSASLVTDKTATLNASVNASNASTVVSFEYGLTTGYGTTVTANQSPLTGTSLTAVSKPISGLFASTTYHFRVIAVNAGATVYGADQTFTTSVITGLSNTSTNVFSVYPNPATTSIMVDLAGKISTVSIYDLNGNTVMTQLVSGKGNVNISRLPKGIYLIKAEDWVQKLLIQ